ncbi:hypothetical protein F5877DRAFT_73532, partial [Lentinula edodes]
MTVDITTNSSYSGLLKVITEEQHLNPADILDDLEESHDQVEVDLSGLSDAIREVSKGVSEKTSQEYLRLMKQCNTFLVDRQMITEGTQFFCNKPHPQAAVYLVAWIMDSCDIIDLDGKAIATTKERSTYTHAQKMRAAATFGFGRVHGL